MARGSGDPPKPGTHEKALDVRSILLVNGITLTNRAAISGTLYANGDTGKPAVCLNPLA